MGRVHARKVSGWVQAKLLGGKGRQHTRVRPHAAPPLAARTCMMMMVAVVMMLLTRA